MSIETELARAGKRLARAMDTRKVAAEQLAEVVRRAHAAGLSEVAIARAANVDRMTVRRYLGKAPMRAPSAPGAPSF